MQGVKEELTPQDADSSPPAATPGTVGWLGVDVAPMWVLGASGVGTRGVQLA